MSTPTLLEIAQQALQLARSHGADHAAARAYQSREVEVAWRDGKPESISDATTRGLALSLYVQGRFSGVSTSDLRPDALRKFIAEGVALTKTLAPDPFRSLPDPKLYAGRAALDLQVCDADHGNLTSDMRRSRASELEQGARTVHGHQAIVSVTGTVSDTRSESARVTSNGFEGVWTTTGFGCTAEVTIADGERRPDDWFSAYGRHLRGLPTTQSVGLAAAQRVLQAKGAQKMPTVTLPLVVENRAAGRLIGALCAAAFGRQLQQKQSFLEGKLGTQIGSARLDLSDQPHLLQGLGSRLWDGDGIAAKRMPVFEKGVLRSYFIDDYYAKKLGVAPTTGSSSNLVLTPGSKDLAELLTDMGEAILVTSFLGGNSNATTGDFSFGVAGVRIRTGQRAEPVCEMNIAGNHKDFWQRLTAVGNDVYPYSAMRSPSLAFEGVVFAGT